LLLLLALSCSLDNTVSTLSPGTTRFKEFRGHSLGGKRTQALRMTKQFYSEPRVRIHGHLSPRPLQVVRVLCLHIGDANLYHYRFQDCILPKPTPVLSVSCFKKILFGRINHPFLIRVLHGSNPALKCYQSSSE